MAIIHRTTLIPSKLELLSGWLPSRPWYAGAGRVPSLTKAGGFRLDDPDGEVGIEFMVVVDAAGDAEDGSPVVYHVPLTYRDAPLDGADDALIGTTEHGVLGRRWVYDGTRDPVLVAQLAALIQGTAEPQAQSIHETPDPTVLSRPASAGQLVPASSLMAGGSLVPAGSIEAADAQEGTEVRVSVGAAGTLVITVSRALVPSFDGNGEDDDVVQGTSGYVTATWRLDDAMVRGVFATATVGS